MTAAGLHSLSSQTKTMLQRLEQPVHIVFFHSHQMGETVEKLSIPASKTKAGSVDHFLSCSTGWAFPCHPKSLEAGIRFLEISSAIKPEPGYPFEFGSTFAR